MNRIARQVEVEFGYPSVSAVGFDGRSWWWKGNAGLKNVYSDESKFRYALSQQLASMQKASKMMESVKDEWYSKGYASMGRETSMNRIAVAKELVAVANMLSGMERTAAVKDLAEIRALVPAMMEKRTERKRKEEEYRQETNRMYADEMKDIKEKSDTLSQALKDAIVDYFNKNGMGVNRVDWREMGGEVFVGSGDGIKRSGSKVVVHMAIGISGSGIILTNESRPMDAYFFLRNETLDDQRFVLAEKNTIANVVKTIAKFDKKGFWSIGDE